MEDVITRVQNASLAVLLQTYLHVHCDKSNEWEHPVATLAATSVPTEDEDYVTTLTENNIVQILLRASQRESDRDFFVFKDQLGYYSFNARPDPPHSRCWYCFFVSQTGDYFVIEKHRNDTKKDKCLRIYGSPQNQPSSRSLLSWMKQTQCRIRPDILDEFDYIHKPFTPASFVYLCLQRVFDENGFDLGQALQNDDFTALNGPAALVMGHIKRIFASQTLTSGRKSRAFVAQCTKCSQKLRIPSFASTDKGKFDADEQFECGVVGRRCKVSQIGRISHRRTVELTHEVSKLREANQKLQDGQTQMEAILGQLYGDNRPTENVAEEVVAELDELQKYSNEQRTQMEAICNSICRETEGCRPGAERVEIILKEIDGLFEQLELKEQLLHDAAVQLHGDKLPRKAIENLVRTIKTLQDDLELCENERRRIVDELFDEADEVIVGTILARIKKLRLERNDFQNIAAQLNDTHAEIGAVRRDLQNFVNNDMTEGNLWKTKYFGCLEEKSNLQSKLLKIGGIDSVTQSRDEGGNRNWKSSMTKPLGTAQATKQNKSVTQSRDQDGNCNRKRPIPLGTARATEQHEFGMPSGDESDDDGNYNGKRRKTNLPRSRAERKEGENRKGENRPRKNNPGQRLSHDVSGQSIDRDKLSHDARGNIIDPDKLPFAAVPKSQDLQCNCVVCGKPVFGGSTPELPNNKEAMLQYLPSKGSDGTGCRYYTALQNHQKKSPSCRLWCISARTQGQAVFRPFDYAVSILGEFFYKPKRNAMDVDKKTERERVENVTLTLSNSKFAVTIWRAVSERFRHASVKLQAGKKGKHDRLFEKGKGYKGEKRSRMRDDEDNVITDSGAFLRDCVKELEKLKAKFELVFSNGNKENFHRVVSTVTHPQFINELNLAMSHSDQTPLFLAKYTNATDETSDTITEDDEEARGWEANASPEQRSKDDLSQCKDEKAGGYFIDGKWCCAAGKLCKRQSENPLHHTLHKCFVCGLKVHSYIDKCAIEPTPEEENRRHYCVLCGRPDQRTDED